MERFSGSWRGIVGVIKPTHRPGSLEEFIRLLPEGIGVISKFVDVREGVEREFVDAFAAAEKIIAELAEMKWTSFTPKARRFSSRRAIGARRRLSESSKKNIPSRL
jgi:hypothetical protein